MCRRHSRCLDNRWRRSNNFFPILRYRSEIFPENREPISKPTDMSVENPIILLLFVFIIFFLTLYSYSRNRFFLQKYRVEYRIFFKIQISVYAREGGPRIVSLRIIVFFFFFFRNRKIMQIVKIARKKNKYIYPAS